MTTQKERWAAKAAKYREWAAKAQAEAERLIAPAEAARRCGILDAARPTGRP